MMAMLVPAMGFLYLHDSAVDLYLKSLREAIGSLPIDVLKVEYGCFPVVTDYSHTETAANAGVKLGFGFHHSDFEKDPFSMPRKGLVFCLNPPFRNDVENVQMLGEYSSFMIKDKRFILTDEQFNLDEIVCCELKTAEKYKKFEPVKHSPTEDMPF